MTANNEHQTTSGFGKILAEDTKEQERRKKYYEDHAKELIELMQQTKEQS